MKPAFFTALYLAIAVVNLLGELLEQRGLVYLSKPLIVIALIVFFGGTTTAEAGRFRSLILLALAFSWLGDMLLMLPWDLFLAGLGAFLLAHVCFTAAFLSPTGRSVRWRETLLGGVPIYLYGGLSYWLLVSTMAAEMRLPVAAYSLALVLMVLAALSRWRRVPPDSFRLVLLGALLFALSDSLIGLREFRAPFPLDDVAVMATYMAGQFLIVLGSRVQLVRSVGAPS